MSLRVGHLLHPDLIAHRHMAQVVRGQENELTSCKRGWFAFLYVCMYVWTSTLLLWSFHVLLHHLDGFLASDLVHEHVVLVHDAERTLNLKTQKHAMYVLYVCIYVS